MRDRHGEAAPLQPAAVLRERTPRVPRSPDAAADEVGNQALHVKLKH